jgi:DNA-directed RNA polymerase subunit N
VIIPIRCMTCGAPLAQYWEEFRRRVEAGEDPEKVLDDLGVKRFCCRRTLLAHVPAIYEVRHFRRIL